MSRENLRCWVFCRFTTGFFPVGEERQLGISSLLEFHCLTIFMRQKERKKRETPLKHVTHQNIQIDGRGGGKLNDSKSIRKRLSCVIP